MPANFAEASDQDNEVCIVVIGASSALGVPYEGWLSVGVIVEHELEQIIPSRRFRVEVLGREGSHARDNASEARRTDSAGPTP